jgi:ADP-ribose pyrophosphatase
MDLIEHCINSETIATGSILTIKRDMVRLPNGNTSHREYVMHPGAVVIVPLLPNGKVVLEKQFRYALHQVFIELPAGKIDANEDVLHTGQRELLEETGYSASQWIKLGYQHPCIGYSDEVIHIFLATDLIAGVHQPDYDETLEVFEVEFQDCLAMINNGKITDGKTIIALLLAEKYLQKNDYSISK